MAKGTSSTAPAIGSVSGFDSVAASFERDRALPPAVPAAVRRTLLEQGAIDPNRPLLEVGCGTGRLGRTFCDAGDDYVGVDASADMLREFRRESTALQPRLVVADGGALPFGDAAFSGVMMMHVLTAKNWGRLLAEAERVLCRRGALVVGKAEHPADGIDAAMRRRLEELLAEMGAAEPMSDSAAIGEWLSSRSCRYLDVVAAAWAEDRSPRAFFRRKQSAARFGRLPAGTRDAALRSLAEWAERSIGPLDLPRRELHDFRLQIWWLRERG